MPKAAGTMTETEIRREIMRRADALVRDGLSPENAITAAGSSFRAERKRQADKEIENVKRWLDTPSRRSL